MYSSVIYPVCSYYKSASQKSDFEKFHLKKKII